MKIDPQYVRECYIKHGLKPKAGNPRIRGNQCCAIGAIAFDRDGNTDMPYESFKAAFPDISLSPFFTGFDDALYGFSVAKGFMDDDKDAYLNGRAVAEAVKDLAVEGVKE